MMRAIIATGYGPPEVLDLREIEEPVPKDDEVLVRVKAATVTSGDVMMRSLTFPDMYWLPMRLLFGFGKPRDPVPGHELAGVVEAVGKAVDRFEPGDAVFGTTGMRSGTNAEYACVPAKGLARKPDGVTFEDAAALPVGGTTALHFLRRGGIAAGQKVLVYGASGSVGSFAVQLAKHFGARVTGVCSTANLDLVRSIGADDVIDYSDGDLPDRTGVYDIIFDTVGRSSFGWDLRSLKPDGRLLLGAVFNMSWYLRGPWTTMTSRRKVVSGIARVETEDLGLLGRLAAEGALRPVIDRHFGLEEVPAAHRYVDSGHKRGNVLITLQ